MIQPRGDVMGETVRCLSLVLVLVFKRLEDTFCGLGLDLGVGKNVLLTLLTSESEH